MKKLLLFLFFALVNTLGYCQFNFKSDDQIDSLSESGLTQRYHLIDSAFSLQKDNEFELRFWTGHILSRSWEVLILTYKNNNWKGRFFIKQYYPETEIIEVELPNKSVDKLFMTLKRNNLFTLPDKEVVFEKYGNKIELDTREGIGYIFQLFTVNKTKIFRYSNPQIYNREFPKIKEFKSVVKMVNAITEFCRSPKQIK